MSAEVHGANAPEPAPEPTSELIRAARGGSVEGWRKIDERYRHVLKLVMRGRIPPDARARFDTDDLLQSGFLVAFRNLDSYEYRGQGSFQSWLKSIMVTRLQTRLRQLKTSMRDPAKETADHAAELRSLETPSELLSTAERQTRIAMILGGLPDLERRLIEMKWFDKQSIQAIATELGMPPTTVARRLGKAAEQIHQRLAD